MSNPNLQTALGQKIRALRTEKGYSQEAFADACGVHRTFMGIVERGGSNISLNNLAKIAATLDVTLSFLLADIEIREIFALTKKSFELKENYTDVTREKAISAGIATNASRLGRTVGQDELNKPFKK